MIEEDYNQVLVSTLNLLYNITEDILVEIEKQGITKQQLAHKLDWPTSYIESLLEGEIDFSLVELTKIAHVLNCKIKIEIIKK